MRRRVLEALGLSIVLSTIPFVPGARAQGWNMYESYGAGAYLEFVPPLGWTQAWPPGGARTDSPYLHLSFGNDPYRHTALMDTGSTGVVVAMRYIDRPEQYQNLGAGSITYSSSGNIMNGEWLLMPLTIRGANGQAIRTDPVRVLAVTSVACTSYQRSCTPIADPAQVDTLMIGIGFGREGDSQAQGVPSSNPFLNVVNETGSPSRRGYVLTKDGISIGLTPSSTAGAFAYTKLLPYPGIPDEWSQAPACVAFGSSPAACGGIALVDTGVTTMYLSSVLEPADGVTLGETATGQRTVLPGTVLSFFLPGQGQVTYTFTPGDPANPLQPGGGVNFDGSDKTFFNTSVMFLNGFDYLYDADGGFVGYRWTGEAPSRYGSVIPRMALTGFVVLDDGFKASLPATLMADTTLVPQGSALLSGIIEGEAGLVVEGSPSSVVTLTGQNRYTGGTTVSAGTLAVSRDANLGASSGALTLDGGTLRADASFTMRRPVTITGNNGAIDTRTNSVTLAGPLSGPGGLIKTGTGLLALAGNAQHQGGTVIGAGTLTVGDGGTRGSLGGR
ncbi:MAG: autotransporter-associated beta strand repeat-containing protein, partial [Microvirga sp.]